MLISPANQEANISLYNSQDDEGSINIQLNNSAYFEDIDRHAQ